MIIVINETETEEEQRVTQKLDFGHRKPVRWTAAS